MIFTEVYPLHRLAKLATPTLLLLALALLFVPAHAQSLDTPQDTITLTSPNNVTIPESDDYATQVLADPADMNNLDDVKMPYHFGVPSLDNGIWSNTTTVSDAHIFLQQQSYDIVYSSLGEKDGVNYPIDTNRFRHLQMRVNVSQGGSSAIWWFQRYQRSGASGNSNIFQFQPGWHIYDIDLTTLGGSSSGNWLAAGSMAGLRVDAPWNSSGNTVQYDWARLTTPTTPVRVTWNYTASGSPTVNLYLSNSSTPSDDNEYLIATAPATNRSYTWTGAGMPPGTYYIHAEMNGALSSSGPLNVNTAPLARIDAPSPLSGEDFAAARMGSVWQGGIQFQRSDNITRELDTPDYFQASATNSDPQVMWTILDQAHPIDTNRYRYMSLRLFLQPPHDLPAAEYNAGPRMTFAQGARTDWQQTRHILAPYNRWLPLTYDLATAPLEPGATYGWSGPITSLRFDPHEEDDSTGQSFLPDFFRIANAHLTSNPISGPATIIRWSALQGAGSVDLYFDNDNSGYNGSLIARDLSLNSGAFSWDTSSLPNGSYWVYLVTHDGLNSGRSYSLVPLVVDHASTSTLFSDVPTNYPFATDINNLAMHGIISGYVQADNSYLFRPINNATRAQLSKMVVLAAGGQPLNPPSPTFADVPSSYFLYGFIEAAAQRGIISGYQCGGPNEPCDTQNRPYFRPANNVTRGQTAKMVVISRGWQNEPVGQNPTFLDVPSNYTFYNPIEIAARHAIIGGYSDRSFRPGNLVTRAQLSKMISRSLP